MTRETYERLWRERFMPFARKLSTDFRMVSFRPTKKESIWEKFQSNIEKERRDYFGLPAVLDRHKFAAIFTSVVLEVQPFRVADPTDDRKRKLPVGEFAANEAWAWYCAREIVLDLISVYATQQNHEILRLVYKDGFQPPPCGGDSYDEHVIKSLYLARASGRFDRESFLHILYMLEVYTAEFHRNLMEGALGA